MNWFELSVKSRANESVPVSLPTIYSKTSAKNPSNSLTKTGTTLNISLPSMFVV